MRERHTHGQALAELAVTLPVLAVILVSLFDFGMLLYAHIQVANAAREGARAASLYRSTRFEYTTGKCNGIDGWSLDDTVQQAIVTRALDNQGCRNASGTIQGTSLGWLDPAPATYPWTATVSPTLTDTANGPTPGDRATLTLVYQYRMIIISKFVPALQDPIQISKSVNYEYTP